MMIDATHPAFSMIVPTYQRRDMVCDTVKAIGRIQYAGRFELVIVVDGSTDGTADALRAIALPFPVTIIEQPNGGLGHARNRGADAASGDILFFLDDDMICEADIVTQHARSYAAGADGVLGNIPLDSGSPPGFLTEGIAVWANKSAEESQSDAPMTPFHMAGGHFSVRKSVFDQLGGFDTTYTVDGNYGQEDADFGVKLLERFDVRFNPEAVSHHRYIVTPRENLQRAYLAGRADVKFARKHPEFARSLFHLNHGAKRATRYFYRPVGRLPLLPKFIGYCAGVMATVALKTPLRSNRQIARIYYAARQVVYWSAVHHHGELSDESHALILCYHAIADHSHDPVLSRYSLAPDQFKRQIDSLQRRGYNFVSGDQLFNSFENGGTLPERAVLLTFDDCYTDMLDAARDILAPRGIPAIAFAVTAVKSGTNEWDQADGIARLELLDPAGLRELSQFGVEIGCHSRTHPVMPELNDQDLSDETVVSATELAGQTGMPARFFAYPYGAHDDRSARAVADAGYDAAFVLADKWARSTNDLHCLPRVEIISLDTPWRFWLKTTWPRMSTFLRSRHFG